MRGYLAVVVAACVSFQSACADDEFLFNTEHVDVETLFHAEEHIVNLIDLLLECTPQGMYENLPLAITLDVELMQDQILIKSAKKESPKRNYLVPVSAEEKGDLKYILNTLATSSLPSLAGSRPSLKRAGSRIDHLHPLRFLMTVFTDEELKANISAIRQRGWVWDQFFEGLEDSLKEESKKNNLKEEYIQDFAQIIGVNSSIFAPSIYSKRWKDLVQILIDTVPRTGNFGRYDM